MLLDFSQFNSQITKPLITSIKSQRVLQQDSKIPAPIMLRPKFNRIPAIPAPATIPSAIPILA